MPQAPKEPADEEKAQHQMLMLQLEHFRSEGRLQLTELRLRNSGHRVRIMLETMLGFGVIAAMVALGAITVNAAQDRGLQIEPFSVPQSFQSRGLTGDVLAAQLVDKLATINLSADSARAIDPYRSNYANDMKLEIPETGISVDELQRYLRRWLGHGTRIGGDLVTGPDGVHLRVRIGEGPAKEFSGPEGELDTLLQSAAETIYARTQPHRYAAWLLSHGREVEAEGAFRGILVNGKPTDRLWARVGLGAISVERGDYSTGIRQTREAAVLDPQMTLAFSNLAQWEKDIGHDENSLGDARTARLLFQQHARNDIEPAAAAASLAADEGLIAEETGDYAQAARRSDPIGQAGGDGRPLIDGFLQVQNLVRAHDSQSAAVRLRDLQPSSTIDGFGREVRSRAIALPLVYWAIAHDDWPGALVLLRQVEVAAAQDRSLRVRAARVTYIWPLMALAMAKTGDTNGAAATIALTPVDCYSCVETRGMIAAEARDEAAAEGWFAAAERAGPSLPSAFTHEGEYLSSLGKTDAAIEAFRRAGERGPRFAETYESWGEALLAKRDFDGALSKIQQALRLAPRWGRVHLSFAKALSGRGDWDLVLRRLAIARQMDLTPKERLELERLDFVIARTRDRASAAKTK